MPSLSGDHWNALPKSTTSFGTPIAQRPAIDYEQDTCVITREVLYDLERAAERGFGADADRKRVTQAEARWHRSVAALRQSQRDREDGRLIAWLFAFGAFGTGLSVAMAAALR